MTAMMTDSPQAAAAIRPMMYRSWLMSCKAITIQHVLCQDEGQHACSRQKGLLLSSNMALCGRLLDTGIMALMKIRVALKIIAMAASQLWGPVQGRSRAQGPNLRGRMHAQLQGPAMHMAKEVFPP
jgi:hypothetical protein